jgi:hypothetical protein
MIKKILIKNILWQAKIFLDDAGEFYPFGSAITKEGVLKPFSFYMDEEHPNSTEMFHQLSSAVLRAIESGEYKAAAIGLDVTIDGRDGMEIRIYEAEGETLFRFLVYKDENGYSFEEMEL